jgi:hypothetical protein
MVDMICLFQLLGFTDYQTLTLPGTDAHSFHYWNYPDNSPPTVLTPLVKDDVIAFLDAHLK